jgi:hypothetical protein
MRIVTDTIAFAEGRFAAALRGFAHDHWPHL